MQRIRELEKRVLRLGSCRDDRNLQTSFMVTIKKKAKVNKSPIKLVVFLLVNHCKIQPVYQMVSYDAIKRLIQFDLRQTREGRAIMRQALRDLPKGWIRFSREAWLWYLLG
jgi:hypothetical protein